MDCPYCERKAEYRTISWDPREHLMQKMHARLDTEEGYVLYLGFLGTLLSFIKKVYLLTSYQAD